MKEIIKVEGMMCPHCEKRAKQAIEAVAGVTGAVCSHTEGTAVVTGEFDVEAVKKAIEDAGYEVQ